MIRQLPPVVIGILFLTASFGASEEGPALQPGTQTPRIFAIRPVTFDTDESSPFDKLESPTRDLIEPESIFSIKLLNPSRRLRASKQSTNRLCKASTIVSDSNPSIESTGLDSFDQSDCCVAPDGSSSESSAWRPLDTLSLFGGLEGSKQPQDFGVNANFGSRWAANWGIPLLAEYGLGAQIGTSINHTDNAVQVFDRVGETSQRTQSFSTVGLFQRTGNWRWGLGYDFLYESYYDQFFLGQFRGRGGYAVTEADEFGVWFTVSQHHDSGTFLNVPVTLTPLSQGSIYWQHQFVAGTRTMAWVGVSEGHAQANFALGDLKKTGDQFVFGAEVDVPLNRFLALYGQANFISPADTGTVDSYLGIAYYPGGHAMPAMRNPFTPLLSLANSTMFATDFRRN